VTHWSTFSSKAGDGGGRRAVLSETVVFGEQLLHSRTAGVRDLGGMRV